MGKEKKSRKGRRGKAKPSQAEQTTSSDRPPNTDSRPGAPQSSGEERREARRAHFQMLASVATSMWYLKTKHFGKAWVDEDTDMEDPRDRRALGRLAKGVQALAEGGVEVHDPTHERYPEGGEAMMKPVQMIPTEGFTEARVTETVRPIVYFAEHLIQRGEVFVATPIEPAAVSSIHDAPADEEESSDTKER